MVDLEPAARVTHGDVERVVLDLAVLAASGHEDLKDPIAVAVIVAAEVANLLASLVISSCDAQAACYNELTHLGGIGLQSQLRLLAAYPHPPRTKEDEPIELANLDKRLELAEIS